MAELKPCPFCGGEARLSTKMIGDAILATICCRGCFVHFDVLSMKQQEAKEIATEVWDRRAEDGK